MKISCLESQIQEITKCRDRASLEVWQLEQIRSNLSQAKSSSRFYRKLFANVDPSALNNFSDFAQLPMTTPDQLRDAPMDWLCCSQAEVSRIITLKTSGTTAQPKRVFFNDYDQQRTVDFFDKGMHEMVSPGDKVLVLMPGAQPGSVGDLLARGLTQAGIGSVIAGPVSDVVACYEQLRETGCNCIVGIPVQVLALAQYGASLPAEQRAHLKSVLLSADTAPAALIARTAKLLDCPVFNHFGMTEMGFGVAVECGARAGCHIREADILVEVVDPETGHPLPLGEIGEFVFTTLRQQAMPFFRYRTGDLGYLAADPCPCGSYIRRMIPLGGRRTNRLTLPGGDTLTLWDLDEILFSLDGVVDYTVKLEGASLHLTLFGIVPPDPEAIRNELYSRGGQALLGDCPLTIESTFVKGFRNGGMQKRSVQAPGKESV